MSTVAEIDQIVTRFLDGQPFMAFWRTFMDAYESFDDAQLAPEDRARFEELYERVYMGAADPVSREEHALGLRGETELRAALRGFRLAGGGSTAI